MNRKDKHDIKENIDKTLPRILREDDITSYAFNKILQLAKDEIKEKLYRCVIQSDQGMKKLDDVLNEHLRDELMKTIKSSDLYDLLGYFILIRAYQLMKRRYIEFVKNWGTLITNSSSFFDYYKNKSDCVVKGIYLIPKVFTKEELLTVIAAASPTARKSLRRIPESWIMNKELVQIFIEIYKDESKLLDYYPELVEPLYILLEIADKEIEEKIRNIPSRSYVKNYQFKEVWKMILNKLVDQIYFVPTYSCKNGWIIELPPTDVINLKSYSCNIKFWYEYAKNYEEKIEEMLETKCKEYRKSYLEELNTWRSLFRRVV